MPDTTNIKGIEQGRAKFAYECACKGKEKKYKNYKSYVKKIPMYIKTNGLGATLAFVYSKKKDKEKPDEQAYDLICNQIKEWLIKDEKKLVNIKEEDDLVEKVISLNSPEYRAVTIELLAFFNWLKRFADGLIEDKDKAEEENNE